MTNDDRTTLLRFHRPKLRLSHASNLPKLRIESKHCIQNLLAYRAPTPLFTFPRRRCAAVLVALFVGRAGDLYVLLSQRASTLRTYAGDTALPGGKWEDGDRTLEHTARREAFEEIGLPMDKTKVPLLCILEPHLTGAHLIVFPVVVLILDNTLRPLLNQDEVSSLFSHPLRAFLTLDTPSFSASRPPFFIPPFNDPTFRAHADSEPLPDPTIVEADAEAEPPTQAPLPPRGPPTSLFTSPSQTDAYYAYTDIPWSGSHDRRVRMHRFLTGREVGGKRPIFGLTAAILIRTASIGLAQAPLFDLYASNEPTVEERIIRVFTTDEHFREDARAEGLDPDAIASRAQRIIERQRHREPSGEQRKGSRAKSRL